MSYIEMTVLAAATTALVCLPLLVILFAVSMRRAASACKAEGATREMRDLGVRMEEMRKDFDWLVSDRMIEQAVSMARLGQPPESIAQNTGISPSELDAIRKLRH